MAESIPDMEAFEARILARATETSKQLVTLEASRREQLAIKVGNLETRVKSLEQRLHETEMLAVENKQLIETLSKLYEEL